MTNSTTSKRPSTPIARSRPPGHGHPRRASRARSGLWPRRGRLAIFMVNRIGCPVCRMAAEACGRVVAQRLHVVLTGDTLVVTEADNLHNPGRSLCGRRILDGAHALTFRLLSEPVAGIAPARHLPAAGIAVLSWRRGQYQLRVIGSADGMQADHDCLFDAVEIVPAFA